MAASSGAVPSLRQRMNARVGGRAWTAPPPLTAVYYNSVRFCLACRHDRALSMQQHRNLGSNELRQKLERVTRIRGRVAGNLAGVGSELRANTHLHGRDVSFHARAVYINPMPGIVETEKHG